MSTYEVEVRCTVKITINDPDVIDRVTGPGGDEWRTKFYPLFTAADVLNYLAVNCVVGHRRALCLEGWADLPADALLMKIERGSIEAEVES